MVMVLQHFKHANSGYIMRVRKRTKEVIKGWMSWWHEQTRIRLHIDWLPELGPSQFL